MYTNQEISKQRQKFWTIIGQYMKPVPGANGEAVNWLNYKTSIRNLFFRMDADQQKPALQSKYAILLKQTGCDTIINLLQ